MDGAEPEELVIEASRAGALFRGVLGRLRGSRFLRSEVRLWGVLGGLGVVVWALFEVRSKQRFWVERQAGVLVTSSNVKLPLASLGEVSLKGPHQEAPNTCEVMVDLGNARWV